MEHGPQHKASHREHAPGRVVSYQPFDPKAELVQVWHAPKAAQSSKERLVDYKESLRQQTLGTAETVRTLFERVQSNPAASAEELLSLVEERAPRYRFTPAQVKLFSNAIEAYEQKHEAVEAYRALYPNDADLYEACFGVPPVGTVEVVKGPMTLCFRCFSTDDFHRAHRGDNAEDGESTVAQERTSPASVVRGGSIPRVAIDALAGTVIIENTHLVENEHDSLRTRRHEEQHQFDRLFTPLELRESELEFATRILAQDHPPREALQLLLLGFVRISRREIGFDRIVRDEILAHVADGSSIVDTRDDLLQLPGYDYTIAYAKNIATIPGQIRALLQGEFLDELFAAVGEGKIMDAARALDLQHVTEPDIEPLVVQVFVDEYRDDVVRWTQAIEALEAKGYSKDEILPLLYAEPASAWQALSRRMEPKS